MRQLEVEILSCMCISGWAMANRNGNVILRLLICKRDYKPGMAMPLMSLPFCSLWKTEDTSWGVRTSVGTSATELAAVICEEQATGDCLRPAGCCSLTYHERPLVARTNDAQPINTLIVRDGGHRNGREGTVRRQQRRRVTRSMRWLLVAACQAALLVRVARQVNSGHKSYPKSR